MALSTGKSPRQATKTKPTKHTTMNFYDKEYLKKLKSDLTSPNYKPQKRIKVSPDKIALQNASGWLSPEEKQEIIGELNDMLALAEERLNEAIAIKGDSEKLRGTGYNAFFAMARENVFKKHGVTESNKLEVIYSDSLAYVMGIIND